MIKFQALLSMLLSKGSAPEVRSDVVNRHGALLNETSFLEMPLTTGMCCFI